MKVFQAALVGKNCSNRGVRYRLLSSSEIDSVNDDVAKQLGTDATLASFQQQVVRECVNKMLVAVTDELEIAEKPKAKPAKGDEGAAPEPDPVTTALLNAKWRKVTSRQLVLDGMFDELFTAKDSAILAIIFRQNHEVSRDELESIVGKAQPVSTD